MSGHPTDSETRNRRFDLYTLKGLVPFFAIGANLVLWILPLIILALLKIVLPFPEIRKIIYKMMAWIYYLAAWFDGIVLFHIMGIRLEISGIEPVYPGKFYLVIANHQSWSDILIMQHLFNFKAPLVKFLTKREMMFVPVIGLICWAYDFPFLQRKSFKSGKNQSRRNDSYRLTIALDKFKQSSATIMNFVEGTRYSKPKASQQHSPYNHLLKPKARGLHTIFKTLGNRINAIIDVTIIYDLAHPDFWDFLSGRCKRVIISAQTLSLEDAFGSNGSFGIPPDIETVNEWIGVRWNMKDNEIDKFNNILFKLKNR